MRPSARFWLIVSVGLFLSVPHSVPAQTRNSSIIGRVLGPNDSPPQSAPFPAWVEATDVARGEVLTVQVDAAGNYAFNSMMPGDYILKFNATALEMKKQKVHLEAGETLKLLTRLKARKEEKCHPKPGEVCL